jgi:hypothetical protein
VARSAPRRLLDVCTVLFQRIVVVAADRWRR